MGQFQTQWFAPVGRFAVFGLGLRIEVPKVVVLATDD